MGPNAPSLAERRDQGTRVFAILRRSRPFSQRSFFQNWGKAPCAFMGAVARATPKGRCEPPQSTPASQEARSICLGRSEPRLPSRLCGKNTLAVLRRSRPFLLRSTLFLINWGKAPRGCGPCHRFRGGVGAMRAPTIKREPYNQKDGVTRLCIL